MLAALVTAMKELIWITQLGFSIISPLLVFVLGAAWLKERFDLGAWVIILGLFLGLGGAVSAGMTFYRHTKKLTKPAKQQGCKPVSFNEHD